MAFRATLPWFRNPVRSAVAITIILQFVFAVTLGQSGDGPLAFEDDDDLFGKDSKVNKESEVTDDWEIDDSPNESSAAPIEFGGKSIDDTSSVNVGLRSSKDLKDPPNAINESVLNGTDGNTPAADAELNPEDTSSNSGSIYLITAAIVCLFLICAVWRCVQARRHRMKTRRRNLRNHALNGNVVEKRPEARELLTMNGKTDDVEVGEKTKEVPLPATFTTTVTVEQMDSLTQRLSPPSPPPTYDEYIRSSMDQLDRSTDSDEKTLPSLGPSYR